MRKCRKEGSILMATKTKKTKKEIIMPIIIVVLSLVVICLLIALLLYRNSAEVRTRKVAEKYHESITLNDSKSIEKLLLDKDRAEIVKAAGSIDKYFDSVNKAILARYGSGFTVSVGSFEYKDLDSVAKKDYNTAYETEFAQVGIVSFDITFASAPTAQLDSGEASEIVETFRDSMVVVKSDGKWYVALSAGLGHGLSQRYHTVLEIGDKRVTIAEYNFFYNMLSSGLSEGETLSDGEALAYVTEVYTMRAAAEKAGFKPEQEDIEEMEKQLAEIKKAASAFGDATEKYYSAYYGMGMTEELLYDVYYSQLIMQSYISKITEDTKPSDDEMQSYYDKNKEKFDTIDFVYYEIYSGVEGSLSDATERATQVLANSSNVEEFKANTKAIYEGLTEEQKKLNLYMKEAAVGENYTYYDFQDVAFEYRDWVFSQARAAGDKKYFVVDSGDKDIGYIVVMAYLISPRSRAEYNTVNFMYATVSTDNIKEDEALSRLTAARDEWLAGDKTKESFIKLADKFYESESKDEDGGSYVRISKGDMAEPIDKWMFDESRKEGDVEIIKSEGGYHLVYFVGQDITKWKLEVKSEMSYENVSKVYEDTTREVGIKVLGSNIAMYC